MLHILKIKNIKLTILFLIFLSLFTGLGLWQLSRAHQKEYLISAYNARTKDAPLSVADLHTAQDLRFYRVALTGSFDNKHTFFLDNKTFHGQVGYEVYTPFKVKGFASPILIDRGFVPVGKSRKELPGINAIIGNVTITGMINVPPTYVTLGSVNDTPTASWPKRLEVIQLHMLAKMMDYPELYTYVVNIEPNDPAAYDVEWKMTTMTPERHRGYAFQWFALALTLLILFVVLNLYSVKKTNDTAAAPAI